MTSIISAAYYDWKILLTKGTTRVPCILCLNARKIKSYREFRRVKLLTYESNAVILASAERIWTLVADVTRWHEWTPTIASVEPLDSGLIQQGSRFRIVQPRLDRKSVV